MRREQDDSFRKFLQYWAEWNELLGYQRRRLSKASPQMTPMTSGSTMRYRSC